MDYMSFALMGIFWVMVAVVITDFLLKEIKERKEKKKRESEELKKIKEKME